MTNRALKGSTSNPVLTRMSNFNVDLVMSRNFADRRKNSKEGAKMLP